MPLHLKGLIRRRGITICIVGGCVYGTRNYRAKPIRVSERADVCRVYIHSLGGISDELFLEIIVRWRASCTHTTAWPVYCRRGAKTCWRLDVARPRWHVVASIDPTDDIAEVVYTPLISCPCSKLPDSATAPIIIPAVRAFWRLYADLYTAAPNFERISTYKIIQ